MELREIPTSRGAAFVDFVLDQLADIDAMSARRMFGGTGLYAGDVFFGIVFADILYLKVNEATRETYERAGMNPFKPYRDRPTTMQYYEVPVQVLEDRDELAKWARGAIAVAIQSRRSKSRASTRRRAFT